MAGLGLEPRTARRRPGLTPMIDVVFLLLVFFMLAARFGPAEAVGVAIGGGGPGYSGPPRLVSVLPEGLRLNGAPVTDLPGALAPLMAGPDDTIVLRPEGGADTERLVQVLVVLQQAGFSALAVVD